MKAVTKKQLELSDILIPSSVLEYTVRGGDEGVKHYEFVPSKIESLAYNTNPHGNGSHCSMPRLEEVDYEAVKAINLCVEGYHGGGCCPTLKKEDFERLKESCYARENAEMIGKSVTVVYDNNYFVGFLANNFLDRNE